MVSAHHATFLQEPSSSCWTSILLQPKLESKIKFADVYAVELLDEVPVCGPWNTRVVVQGKKSAEVIAFLLINYLFYRVHFL